MALFLPVHIRLLQVANKGAVLIQVCKAGRVKLLDMLIYYGADVNAQNNNGNTPLHICAAEDQVRMILDLVYINNSLKI